MSNVTYRTEDGRLILELSGRIDSANAAQTEAEIQKIRNDVPASGITVDCDELAYMSSAGLRILLRLRKDDPTLTVINVSTELYDIFDMTGFTEMMEVRKAYKRVSTEGCEVIGQGANGTVYRIDRDTIVKAYRNPDALPDIRRERELARKALILGIPTAIPYDVVRIGEGYGSMFELLNARSFAKILAEEPQREDEIVAKIVDLMKKIHSTVIEPGEMPDMKESVIRWTDFLKDHLPAEPYAKLKQMVDAIPADQHMIHGDYHLKNIMDQDGETLLIDMDTLSVGHPIFELAFMYNAFLGYSEVDPNEVMNFLGIDRDLAGSVFYKVMAQYLDTDDEARIQEVVDKAALMGHIRMLRRYIRVYGYDSDYGKVHIENSRNRMLGLLERIDTFLF